MDGMDILYLLVPLSVVLVFVIGVVFWWSLKSGQFEDLEGEGFRILTDDDTTPPAPDGEVRAMPSASQDAGREAPRQ